LLSWIEGFSQSLHFGSSIPVFHCAHLFYEFKLHSNFTKTVVRRRIVVASCMILAHGAGIPVTAFPITLASRNFCRVPALPIVPPPHSILSRRRDLLLEVTDQQVLLVRVRRETWSLFLKVDVRMLQSVTHLMRLPAPCHVTFSRLGRKSKTES